MAQITVDSWNTYFACNQKEFEIVIFYLKLWLLTIGALFAGKLHQLWIFLLTKAATITSICPFLVATSMFFAGNEAEQELHWHHGPVQGPATGSLSRLPERPLAASFLTNPRLKLSQKVRRHSHSLPTYTNQVKNTTFQPMINAKLSQQRCYKKGILRQFQKLMVKICVWLSRFRFCTYLDMFIWISLKPH